MTTDANQGGASSPTDLDPRADLAAEIKGEVEKWLAPLLAGGLSAARTSPIGPTAERLAETILIALENTILGEADRFSVAYEEPPF